MKMKDRLRNWTAKFAALFAALALSATASADNIAKIGDTEYETLAAALNAATTGATIEIQAGTWGSDAVGTLTTSESSAVRSKSLTIQPADGATPVFTSDVYIGYDNNKTANATMTVKGLTFQNARLSLINYVQATVESCSFTGSGDTAAIYVGDSCDTSHLSSDTYLTDQITITNCYVNGTASGAPAVRVRNGGNVTIVGNTILNASHNGILFESNSALDTTTAKAVVIADNTITEWNSGDIEGGGRAIRASLGTMAADSTVTINGNVFRKETLGLDEPDFAKISGAGSATVDLSGNDWNDLLLSETSGNSAIYTCDAATTTITSVITTRTEPVAMIVTVSGASGASVQTEPQNQSSSRILMAAAPRLMAVAAVADVPLAGCNSDSDPEPYVMAKPDEASDYAWAQFSVTKISEWVTKDTWSETFGSKTDPDGETTDLFANRDDLDACYVFSVSDSSVIASVDSTESNKSSVDYYFGQGTWTTPLLPILPSTFSATYPACFVVEVEGGASANSLALYFANENNFAAVEKCVLSEDLSDGKKWRIPASSSSSTFLGSTSDKSTPAIWSNQVIPAMVAIKDVDGANVGKKVTVSLCHKNGDDFIVRASFSHTIAAAALKDAAPVSFTANFSAYQDENGDWKQWNTISSDDGTTQVYQGAYNGLKAAANAITFEETGLKSVAGVAQDEFTTLQTWVSEEWHGCVFASGNSLAGLKFSIEPQLRTIVTNATGTTTSDTTRTITNTEINGNTITFRLPLTDDYTAGENKALVVHESDDETYGTERKMYTVAGDSGARYVQISTTHFSTFTVYRSDALVAYVGDETDYNCYATLADAIAVAGNGGTVTLMQDCSESVTITNGWTVSINQASYNYTGTVTSETDAYLVSSSASSTTITYTSASAVADVISSDGTTTNYYATLAAAVDDAATGETVQLLDDIALTETVVVTNSLTLDLNGYDITATDARALWVKSGTVVVDGTGTISANGDNLSASSSVIRVGDSAANDEAASLTIGASVTVSSAKCYGITVFGKNDTDSDLTTANISLTVNGTVAVTGEAAAIAGNGQSTLSATSIALNGTISSENDYAVYHPGKGTLVINGSVEGLGGIEVKAGTVTIGANATITATATTQSHSVNNNGTSTSGYAIAAVNNSNYSDNITVTISGGTITGKTMIFTEANAEGYGTVTATVSTLATDDDYKWVETSTSGVYKLVEKEYVAQVISADGATTNKYESLTEAVTAANATSGATITLLADVTYSASFTLGRANETMTLDFNGHVITVNSWISTQLTSDSTLNLKDSSEAQTGGLVNGAHSNYSAYSYLFYAYGYTNIVVNIEGGKYEVQDVSYSGLFYYGSKTIEITGGTFTNIGKSAIEDYIADGYMAVENSSSVSVVQKTIYLDKNAVGIVKSDSAPGAQTLTVTNGTASSWSSSDTEFATVSDGTVTFLTANAGVVTIRATAENGSYDECVFVVSEAKVSTSSPSGNYVLLQDAIDASDSGATLTLLGDMELPLPVTVSKNITLDTANYIITNAFEQGYVAIEVESGSKLTLLGNGTITGPYDGISVAGEIEVGSQNNCPTINSTVNGNVYALRIESTGTGVVNNCTINSRSCGLLNNGVATLNGGTINGTACNACGDYYIYAVKSVGTLTVPKGSTLVVNGVHGALGISGGTADIYDGEYVVAACTRASHSSSSNFYALYSAGENYNTQCNVYGGTFKSCGYSVINNGNSGDGGLKLNATLAIYGGTFEATSSSTTILQNDKVLGDPKLYGGTYTAENETKINSFYNSVTTKSYLADGCTLESNGDLSYKVTQSYVAKVVTSDAATTNYYATLKDAMSAAVSGDTIEILCDTEITSGSQIAFTSGTVVIDGAGHTVTPGYTDASFYFKSDSSDASALSVTLTNLVLSSFSQRAVTTDHVALTVTGCTFDGNDESVAIDASNHVLLGWWSAVTITDSVFTNNTAKSVVYVDNDSSLAVDNCLFYGNTCSGSGVVFLSSSTTAASVTGSTFENNSVGPASNAAVVYCSAAATVSGNLFKGNSVNVTSADNKEGVVVLGSAAGGSSITNNAFVGNTLGETATNRATIWANDKSDTFTFDVSGNYWGDGEAPETGTTKDIYRTGTGTMTNTGYAYTYTANSDANGVSVSQAVAKVVSAGETETTTTYYANLTEAVDAAESGETVVLLRDVAATDAIDITKAITLDGDGYVITSTAASGTLVFASDATVKDLAITNTNSSAKGYIGACVSITGATANVVLENVYMSSASNRPFTIDTDDAENRTAVSMTGGEIYSPISSGYTLTVWSPTDVALTNVTMTGYCNIYTKWYWPSGQTYSRAGGYGASGSTFNLKSCTLVTQNPYTDSSNNFGVLVNEISNIDYALEDCTVEMAVTGEPSVPHCLLLPNGGELNNYVLDSAYAKDGVVTNLTLSLKNTTVNLGNGTIMAKYHYPTYGGDTELLVYKASDADTTFTTIESAIEAEGYLLVATEEENWYTLGNRVAMIVEDSGATTNYYATLDAAYTNAESGETITLLADITYDEDREVPVWGKAVNIDLGGHTLTTNSGVSKDLSNLGYKAAAICFAIGSESNVAISNGTIVTAYGAGVYAAGSGLTMTLSDLTVRAATVGTQSTAEYSAAVRITGNATVVIDSGSYTGAYAVVSSNSGGTFEINGGTFAGGTFFNGSTNSGVTKSITITDGVFAGGFTNPTTGTLSISGGIFSTDPEDYVIAGYQSVGNTDEATKDAYPWTIGPITYTATFTDGGVEGISGFSVAETTYTVESSEITLPTPTYTYSGATNVTFAAWTNAEGVVWTTIPAGTAENLVFGAKWVSVQSVTVNVTTTTDDGTTINLTPIKVSDDWITANVTIEEGATDEQKYTAITNALETVAVNGLKEWQNYVMGISTTNHTTLATDTISPIAGAAQTTSIAVVQTSVESFDPPADAGITVKYALYWRAADSSTWTQYGDYMDEPVFDVNVLTLTADETYWKIDAVFTATATTVTSEEDGE